MKLKDLIKKLKGYPEDTEILYSADRFDTLYGADEIEEEFITSVDEYGIVEKWKEGKHKEKDKKLAIWFR